MKKTILLMICMILVLTGCRQTDSENNSPDEGTSLEIAAVDQKNDSGLEDYEKYNLSITSLVKSDGPIKNMFFACNGVSEDFSVEYEEMTAETDRTRILTDVLHGSGPDILFVTSDDMKYLNEKGALDNLLEYLPNEYTNNILDNVISYGSISEKLVGLPAYLNGVRTYFASKETKDNVAWTIDGLLAIKEQNNSVERLFTYQLGKMDAYFELYSLIAADLQHTRYIDWKQGKSHFEDYDFAHLLEVVKEDTENSAGGSNMVEQGAVLAYYFPVSGAVSMYTEVNRLGDKGAVVGFPTEEGGKNYFYTDGLIVINKNTKQKEAIKQVLMYILSPDLQFQNPNIFSVRKDAAQLAITEQIIYEEDGEAILSRKNMWQTSGGSSLSIPLEGSKQELVELYNRFISAVYEPNDIEDIFNIIWEEAELFFEGSKKSSDVVKNIDGRVQLYLDERQ